LNQNERVARSYPKRLSKKFETVKSLSFSESSVQGVSTRFRLQIGMIPRCEQGFWHPTRWAGATWSRSEVRTRIWSADTLAPDGTRATTQTTACRPTQEPDPVLAGRSMADESASERPSQGVVLAAFGGATRSEAMSARTCGG
jgi:hypothetical protein